MKKLSWLFLLLPLLAALPGCGGGGTAQTWNYLVYMDGDNNLEQWGVIDLNEMERVGSSANLNIFVLFDRNPGWTSPSPGDDVSNGNWTNTRLYRVTRDNDINTINSQLLEDYPEKNMGNPNTLTEFIVYCQNNYPADRTVLVFWNHGGGVWPQAACSLPPSGRGVCFDDSSNGDCLTTSEVAAALTAARASTGKGVDLINLASA